jgi:hypothetical protein
VVGLLEYPLDKQYRQQAGSLQYMRKSQLSSKDLQIGLRAV